MWISQFPSVFGTEFRADPLRELQTVKTRMRPRKRSGFIEAPLVIGKRSDELEKHQQYMELLAKRCFDGHTVMEPSLFGAEQSE